MSIWIVTVIALVGTVLNANKKRIGFVFWIFSNACLAVYNFEKHEHAQGLLFTVYFILAIYGFLMWRKKEKSMHVSDDGETMV